MSLTVLFDTHCDLCRRIVVWLESQPKYVEMLFVPAAGDWGLEIQSPAPSPQPLQ